jgi:hypothetical protein
MSLRAYTSPELVLLRTNKQFLKRYLTVFKPATIYTGRVNGTPASYDKLASVEYDGGSGTLANVKNGMTIRFGSAAGLRDRGEERVRKAPDADTFNFGETSALALLDNDFITIVDDFQLRAKHIRISGGAALVDYDVTYSNQHTAFDPVPVMGSHRIAWLEGATVAITIPQIADSWVIGSTISSRSTTCAGATVTNGTTTNPTITFNAPGRYVIYTTVTAANGKSFTGVRYAYVHDSTDMPYADFELLDLSGSYEDGGFSARIRLFTDAADVSTFEEGALCILHSVDYYDGEKQTIELETGMGNIRFIGRITNESITINAEQATVEFDLEGFQERGKRTDEIVNLSGVVVDTSGRGSALFSMSQGHVSQNFFPYGVELATNTPTAWTSMPSLTVKRALFDLLHWYSTATQIMDVYIEDDDRLASELSAAGDTLWEKINELAYLSIFASPGVDPYGRLFIEIEPQLVPEADRDAVQLLEITQADWTGKIDIARTPTQRGAPEIIDRLLLASQAQSNQLSGLYYGWHHNELGPIRIDLASHLFGFTLFPRQKAYIEIAATDNVRGIARNLDIIPREVSYRDDPQNGTLLPTVRFEAVTLEESSINGDIPGSESDDISIPPLPPLPPLPSFPPVYPGDPTVEENGPPVVLLVDAVKGLLVTDNFDEPDGADIAYQFWNPGIDPLDVVRIATGPFRFFTNVFMTPNGAVYVCIWDFTFFKKIYRASAIGGMFVEVVDQDWVDAAEEPNAQIMGIGYNPTKSEEVGIVIRAASTYAGHMYLGNGVSGFVQKGAITINNDDAGKLTFGGGKWILDGIRASTTYWHRMSADGMTQELVTSDLGSGGGYHTRAGSGPRIFKAQNSDLLYSLDNATNTTLVNVPEGLTHNGYMVASPDGLQLLATWDVGDRGKSSDGGNTWSGLPNLPFGGEYCFAYAGGVGAESRWIAARGIVRYSDNVFGAESWVEKGGNLGYLIPVSMSIDKIIIPGIHGNY